MILKYSNITFFLFLLVIFSSCKKEEGEAPSATMIILDLVDSKTIKVAGRVSDNGNSAITRKGFVYAVDVTPTMNDNVVEIPVDETFKTEISNLDHNKKYYVSAFAENEHGVGISHPLNYKTNVEEDELGCGIPAGKSIIGISPDSLQLVSNQVQNPDNGNHRFFAHADTIGTVDMYFNQFPQGGAYLSTDDISEVDGNNSVAYVEFNKYHETNFVIEPGDSIYVKRFENNLNKIQITSCMIQYTEGGEEKTLYVQLYFD